MMTGQVGCTDADGKWQVTEFDRIVKPDARVAPDNTNTLPQPHGRRNDTYRPPPTGAPRGPMFDRPGNKRVRWGEAKAKEGTIGIDFYD